MTASRECLPGESVSNPLELLINSKGLEEGYTITGEAPNLLAANALVSEACGAHVIGAINVAQVDHDRGLHQFLDP